jgi:predicted MPP superfamily phosphohydrolase
MALLIREVSDLHLEFYDDFFNKNGPLVEQEVERILPPLATDNNTVLVIAGDLASARVSERIVTFMELVVTRFKHVIYVLGNHEHYGYDVNESLNTIRDALIASSKVDMLKLTIAGNNIETVTIDEVIFHCGTLWTDYDRCNPFAMFVARRSISDHRLIRNGEEPFLPIDAYKIHFESVQELVSRLENKDNSKTVVVTHHMPSYQAVDPKYMANEASRVCNGAFVSNLDNIIMEFRPALWFFGHTHTAFEGKVGDTLLVCNPLGYPREREKNAERGTFTTKVYSL